MSDNDGFTLVTYKHPRKNKACGKTNKLLVNSTPIGQASDNAKQQDLVIHYIDNCKIEIRNTSFYEEIVSSILNSISENVMSKNVKETTQEFSELFTDFVCYGIGQLSESPIARYQFAFLLLLREHFQPQGNCYIYDPVFTCLDKLIIKHFKLDLISKNEEAKRKVSCKTLFFVPHGGKPLYNNILWANWGATLANIVILGNSFHSYDQRIPSSQLLLEASYIARILPLTHEVQFPTTFHHEDIFNDLAIHFFLAHELQRQESQFWDDCKEPVYGDDNVEIVLSRSSLSNGNLKPQY